jgi:hypothetical protein
MIGNDKNVISELYVLLYGVLSKAEKTRALWAVSWYRRMYTYSVIDEMLHKAKSLDDQNKIDNW